MTPLRTLELSSHYAPLPISSKVTPPNLLTPGTSLPSASTATGIQVGLFLDKVLIPVRSLQSARLSAALSARLHTPASTPHSASNGDNAVMSESKDDFTGLWLYTQDAVQEVSDLMDPEVAHLLQFTKSSHVVPKNETKFGCYKSQAEIRNQKHSDFIQQKVDREDAVKSFVASKVPTLSNMLEKITDWETKVSFKVPDKDSTKEIQNMSLDVFDINVILKECHDIIDEFFRLFRKRTLI
ncbi:hypothetical protein BJ508DRAFT_331241 [Ascobolus immersus RN42]|uniref:Uncharacterized protein n=1 Tax=Ascobolus immersus RN42 TaxID=1160509 RepID=A0A3N4I343_ASCIM|nr:hypothetical protein BJ508DRAFT_331241 [Ascobolus immersus RN42]